MGEGLEGSGALLHADRVERVLSVEELVHQLLLHLVVLGKDILPHQVEPAYTHTHTHTIVNSML